jgi:5'-deoxynucleotidase YfbR-like HD superfamily hydrolase
MNNLAHATALARLALRFSRVERITRHEDGVRLETDSDHSIMLALVACNLAPAILNRARIAEFAIVHDLVETYSGDVQTLTIDAAGRSAKEERERAAFARIRDEFGADSWIVRTFESYEAQVEHEARYVRLMDKVLPKLTHLFNGCVAARELIDLPGFIASHEAQHRKLSGEYGGEAWAGPILDLLRDAMLTSENAWASPGADARRGGVSLMHCAVHCCRECGARATHLPDCGLRVPNQARVMQIDCATPGCRGT